MNRAAFIRDYVDTGGFGEAHSLFNALVQCLNPEEACSSLDLDFQQPFPQRRSILRKISRDIGRELLDCHTDLVEELIDTSNRLPYRKKQSCVYALSILFDSLPPADQDYLVRYFLGSGLKAPRRCGYKKLKKSWDSAYEQLVAEVWEKHKDPECAALIIEHFPVSDLRDLFDDLEQAVLGSWPQTKLYLRVASEHPEVLNHVRQADEITHAYLLVKLGLGLEEDAALEMYHRNKLNDELGLLLWCFGQMGLWPVLEFIASEIEQLPYERFCQRDPYAT